MTDVLIDWRDYRKNAETGITAWPSNAAVLGELLPGDRLWFITSGTNLGHEAEQARFLVAVWQVQEVKDKGRKLGIFKPHEEKAKKAREKERGERFLIEVLGRPVPATNTDEGVRAVPGGQPIDPESVGRYLRDKFGENLKAVRSAMQKLAKAYKPQELAHDAYRLYERFRPDIPEGVKGWGAKGDLDLGLIGRVAKGRVEAKSKQLATRRKYGVT